MKYHRTAADANRLCTALYCTIFVVLALSCGEDEPSVHEKKLRNVHAPQVHSMVRKDLKEHAQGINDAASRLVPLFTPPDDFNNKEGGDYTPKEEALRKEMRRIKHIKFGVPALSSSPATLFAIVDRKGVILARHAKNDTLRGSNYGKRFKVIPKSLKEKKSKKELVLFKAQKGGKDSYSMLWVAPIVVQGKSRAALILAMPLWRFAQKISTQLRMNYASEPNLILWAYTYKGKKLFEKGIPPEVKDITPSSKVWHKALKMNPSGATGTLRGFGLEYAWGAFPIKELAEDAGVLLLRAKP